MEAIFKVGKVVVVLSLFSYFFTMCNNDKTDYIIDKSVKERDSVFEAIDRKIYQYKNIAFCDMLDIGNKGCYLKDGSASLLGEYLPSEGEEILRIRAFNDSIIRKQRFNSNKYLPDTLRADMFITGLEFYKSNVYDSMALIALEPFYSKEILEEYKKQNRWEFRNSFKWVIPPPVMYQK